jgi:type II secretory pathway component GspD/PulD (secretin)
MIVSSGLMMAGCSSPRNLANPRPLPDTTEQAGELDTSVISSTPDADAAALAAANEQLSISDWEILESLGPRPIWEQLSKPRDPDARADANADPSEPPVILRPEVIDESLLPMEVTELSDNMVRIIWQLQAFGGTQIKSSREASTSRRSVAVSNADLAPLVQAVQQVFGSAGSVVPMASENKLVIVCPRDFRSNVADLLARLDVLPPQVEITAKIFEVSNDFDFQYGAKLIANRVASDGTQTAISTFSAKRFVDAMRTGDSQPVGSALRLMQVFDSAGIGLDLSFQILAEEGLINVVSSPRMTVALGQTGYMLAGQELPIQSAKIVNGVLQSDTNYKPVGVQLYVTPQTISPDRIRLHAITIVSAVSGFSPLPTMTSDDMRMVFNPIIDSREAETAVTVAPGDTLVISGLKMVRTISRESKIPGLGDLPILGAMFKNHRTQQQATDLYFFLTPRVLDR